jgi:hypothetical protein
MCANVDMKLSLPSWMIAFFVNNMISIAPQNMAKYAMQVCLLPHLVSLCIGYGS